MKKILCICNTYYQLIVAIQMKLTIFNNDKVTVIISNHSNNADKVANQLNKENLFNKVYFLQSKSLDQDKQNKMLALKQIYHSILGNDRIIKGLLNNELYDEFIYYNLNMSTEMIFNYLLNINKNIKCSRFEEGINSYNTNIHDGNFKYLTARMKLTYLGRYLLNRKYISKMTTVFYCFYPQLYKKYLNVKKIPPINYKDVRLRKILVNSFALDLTKIDYKQKYIFFASIGDFEGGEPIGEVEIAKKIAELVGKDNLLVKVHPRDNTNAFEKAGLQVDRLSNMPWEIIQLNYNFSNHIFFTVTSNSVLSVSLIQKKYPRIYFLYPLCNTNKNILMANIIKSLSLLLKSIKDVGLDNIYIINDFNQINRSV